MVHSKEILKAKIEVRHASRELIRIVFGVTEFFLDADKEGVASALRKRVLGISSFLSHGTVKSNVKEQNNDFLVVMGELREVLKLITIAHHLKYCNKEHKVIVRTAIAQVIDCLDKLVILLGGYTEK